MVVKSKKRATMKLFDGIVVAPVYKPEHCEHCDQATWCERRGPSVRTRRFPEGSWQCRGCKIVEFFTSLFEPLGYVLLPWQAKVLRELYGTVTPDDGLRQYRSAYISVAKKQGKAIKLDTPIPVPSGWKTMAEIAVGDRVFDEAGAECNVVAVSPVYLDHDCQRMLMDSDPV